MSWNKWWGNLFDEKVKKRKKKRKAKPVVEKPVPVVEKPKPKLDTVPLFPTTARRCRWKICGTMCC